MDIFVLQLEHLPLKRIKLITGILWYHLILVLQVVQKEPGFTIESSLGTR